MKSKKLVDTLTECIVASLDADKRDFHWEGFFKRWFRNCGTPYYFLFHKHLGVTNTQYVELFSLIETHCVSADTSSQCQFLFNTTEQVKSVLVDSINMLRATRTSEFTIRAREFSETYVDVLAATVAVDMFYCSCAVFLPPGVNVDLLRVCSDAGYIHAAGRSIYVRNIKKSRPQDLHDAMKLHLDNSPPVTYPIPFVVYGRKDFEKDKSAQEEIGQGIEHVKVHFEKMLMGEYRLPHVINELQAAFKDKLYVPPAGEYQEVHDFSSYVNKTIWLVCDRSVSFDQPTTPGKERYYICYEQIYKTANPFFLFDGGFKPEVQRHYDGSVSAS